MDSQKLKSEMMKLWKATFADSDRYISLVFDTYFDPDFVEYEEDSSGNLLAALLAVPYSFKKNEYTIKGAYLCGLATRPEYRESGKMTNLINRISERMRGRGYAFLFLIPANDGLKEYYENRQFFPAFYRRRLHYTAAHDFSTEYFKSISSLEERIRINNIGQYEALKISWISGRKTYDCSDIKCTELLKSALVEYILGKENDSDLMMPMVQNKTQIETFIKESVISDGGVIYAISEKSVDSDEYNPDTNKESNDGAEPGIVGALIWEPCGEDDTIRVKKCFADDSMVRLKLLAALKEEYQEKSLTVFEDESTEQAASRVWGREYEGVIPDAPMAETVDEVAEPYDESKQLEMFGMMRILSLSEILKFVSNVSPVLKYSILAQQENSDKICLYKAENGNLSVEDVTERRRQSMVSGGEMKDAMKYMINDENVDPAGEPVYSWQQIGALLFRRPEEDNIVEEAIGLPMVTASMFLMLE